MAGQATHRTCGAHHRATGVTLAASRLRILLLIVDEDFGPCGVGAEIATQVIEQAFRDLDAPVQRLNGVVAPAPYSPTLRGVMVPDLAAIVETVRSLAAECLWPERVDRARPPPAQASTAGGGIGPRLITLLSAGLACLGLRTRVLRIVFFGSLEAALEEEGQCSNMLEVNSRDANGGKPECRTDCYIAGSPEGMCWP